MKAPERYPLSSKKTWSELVTAVLQPEDLVPSSPLEKITTGHERNKYPSTQQNTEAVALSLMYRTFLNWTQPQMMTDYHHMMKHARVSFHLSTQTLVSRNVQVRVLKANLGCVNWLGIIG